MSQDVERSARTRTGSDVDFVRLVGALERQFYRYAERNPVHFSIVAEFGLLLDEDLVRVALDAVQRRHPLLSVHVEDHGPTGLAFHRVPDVEPIPLVVHERPTPTWEPFVARDLARPFDRSVAPLMRATLITAPEASTLVLTFDHTIADGISSVEIVVDLLDVLNGKQPAALPVPPTQEEMIAKVVPAERYPALTMPPPDGRMQLHSSVRFFDRALPHVHTVALDTADTKRIIQRCQMEQTTVHAAIVTAASYIRNALSNRGFVRVLSPINFRALIEVDGDCAAYFTCTVTGMAPGDDGFWGQARTLTGQLAAARTPGGIRAISNAVQQAVPVDADVAVAHDFFTRVVPFDMLISNLGVQDLEASGPIRPTALWGPIVRTHIDGDPGVGVLTYEGRLRMVSTGFDTPPHFVESVVALLTEMSG
jgi:hypothetical protein